jgi:NAD(P)-dependent dehydrogenase (short-subunit alcohol dehydrogenase family)
MEMNVAVVTGAARGIGRAIAQRLAYEGFVVVVADIDEAQAQLTSTQIAGPDGNATFAVHVDVADPASVHTMVDRVLAR